MLCLSYLPYCLFEGVNGLYSWYFDLCIPPTVDEPPTTTNSYTVLYDDKKTAKKAMCLLFIQIWHVMEKKNLV